MCLCARTLQVYSINRAAADSNLFDDYLAVLVYFSR